MIADYARNAVAPAPVFPVNKTASTPSNPHHSPWFVSRTDLMAPGNLTRLS